MFSIYNTISETIDVPPDVGATFHYRQIYKTKDCKEFSEHAVEDTTLLSKRYVIDTRIQTHIRNLRL